MELCCGSSFLALHPPSLRDIPALNACLFRGGPPGALRAENGRKGRPLGTPEAAEGIPTLVGDEVETVLLTPDALDGAIADETFCHFLHVGAYALARRVSSYRTLNRQVRDVGIHRVHPRSKCLFDWAKVSQGRQGDRSRSLSGPHPLAILG